VLSGLSAGHLLTLLVVGLFLFGPERLPGVLHDTAGVVQQLRRMARDATEELRSELGPEFADLDLADLHPRALVNKHLLADLSEDQSLPAAPRRDRTPDEADAHAAPTFDPDTT
jgi:sec-independent protein translocase protein TatB